MNHDEIYEHTWKNERKEWLVYVENDDLCTAFFSQDIVKLWKKLPDLE